MAASASSTAAGLAGDLEQRLQLGSHARAEELMVVDDQHARPAHSARLQHDLHFRPPAGSFVTRARPP